MLWLAVLLFAAWRSAFLLVRLPEEVDRTDDTSTSVIACRGRRWRGCRRLSTTRRDPAAYAEVTGYERWNLVLVLLVIQALQVLLLALSVFVFFMRLRGRDHGRGGPEDLDRRNR